ncbi:MAG: helix-turn-helix transcriptional regulator [Thermoleophilaceae bacterium]|nr:helix-turn-helix transcriptional regulator [Thermoleophilaceae bacterium]
MALDRPRLRDARVRAGLTQRELAALTGFRQPHIARWEGGQVPRVDTALRLAGALETTVEELWLPEPEREGRAA